MTPDILVDRALMTVWPERREPKRTKDVAMFRRLRRRDGVLLAAAEMLLAGQRHGERAEALNTAALDRAGVSGTQYDQVAPWARERVMEAIRQMMTMTGSDTAPKRGRGRPPKGEAAMTGSERQRVLQERRKSAMYELEGTRSALREISRALEEIQETRRDGSLEIYERLDRIGEKVARLQGMVSALLPDA